MKKICLAISVAAVLFAGCAKTGFPGDETAGGETIADDGLMHFSMDYPSTKATETAFESGDRIGVYITAYENGEPLALQLGGNYKNNNAVTFDGSVWNAEPEIYWEEENSKYDVFAYYPFGSPSSVDEMPFDVAENQNIPETEESLSTYEASDFLFASRKGVTSADGSVNLLFKHKMSKFTVVLKKGEDYEGEIPDEGVSVLIHNTVTSSLIDLSTGDVVKHPMASARTITAKKDASDRYSAIIVPQMILYKQPLIEIICNGVSYMIETRFQFKSGVQHIINVTLDNNPEQVKIEIGGEIEGGWN